MQRTRSSIVWLVATLVAISGVACRHNRNSDKATAIEVHGAETREVLRDEATRISHGPTTDEEKDIARGLVRSGDQLDARSRAEAHDIRTESSARGGGPIVSRAVQQTMADARCEVQANCGQVGPGRRFATAVACTDELRQASFLGWNQASCGPNGFDPSHLDACIAALRAQTCDRLGRDANVARYCAPAVVCRQR